jgi:hypothetical protein
MLDSSQASQVLEEKENSHCSELDMYQIPCEGFTSISSFDFTATQRGKFYHSPLTGEDSEVQRGC